jgi:alpha-glucosidase
MRRHAITAGLVLAAALAGRGAGAAAAPTRLASPDGTIEVHVHAGDRLTYDVWIDGVPRVQAASLALTVDGTTLGARPRVRHVRRASVDRVVEPPVRQKAARLRERYNEARLEMEGRYAVVFRAFDEGVAYRFETALAAPEVTVRDEEAVFRFAGEPMVYFPQEESLFSHQERQYLHLPLKGVAADAFASLPAVVDTGAGGPKIAIAESDVDSYPGLWLKGTGESSLRGRFPKFPLEEKRKNDRDVEVLRTAEFLAKTRGTRTYPWRLLAVARRDGDLLTNPLVYLLAAPSRVADTSWIRPGKVAWDWFNFNNLSGVPFRAGINTETYKHYIDFAARHGLEYVILDEGWYPLGDVMKVAPGMDMEVLTAYAREKRVGLILWVVWKSLEDQLLPALAKFEQWGIQGLKVDFMQRDDQPTMDFYHRICAEAARRKMLVDFHGSQRPALLTRTWPNLVTTEGVRGLEWVKWSDKTEPEHDVTLPFTRMFLGPMDYTPGAMLNSGSNRKMFAPVFEHPMSLGSRAHQLAMYVVYESPLQMLADSPSHYDAEPEVMAFLGPVPTVWDETRVLDGKIGDYVVVARRHGTDWYLGAMTDWTAREIEVDLGFLGAGAAFVLDAWEDGPNADRHGQDYRRVKTPVTAASRVKVKMVSGGGYAARISPAGR